MKIAIFVLLSFFSLIFIGLVYNYKEETFYKFLVEIFVWTSVSGWVDLYTRYIENLFKKYKY